MALPDPPPAPCPPSPPLIPPPTSSPPPPRRRRVQWVGLTEPDSAPPLRAQPTPPQPSHPLRLAPPALSSVSQLPLPLGASSASGSRLGLAHLLPSPADEDPVQPAGPAFRAPASRLPRWPHPSLSSLPERPSLDQLLHQAHLNRAHNHLPHSPLHPLPRPRSNPYFPLLPPDPPLSAEPSAAMLTPDSSRPPSIASDLDIPSGERDGLPSKPDSKPRTFTREAAHLVSLHKFRLGPNQSSSSSSSSSSSPPPAASHHAPFRALSSSKRLPPAASHNASVRESRAALANLPFSRSASLHGSSHPSGFASHPSAPPFSVGNGVLSSLLHLYNHPISAQSSSATLINYASSDDDSDPGPPNPGCSTPTHTRQSSDADPQNLPPLTPSSPRPGSVPNVHPGGPPTSSPLHQVVARLAKKQWSSLTQLLHDDRPSQARSNAGVLGALQASAMGLAGAAAPPASSVAPAPSKSGFRLARYRPDPEKAHEMTSGCLSSDQPYQSALHGAQNTPLQTWPPSKLSSVQPARSSGDQYLQPLGLSNPNPSPGAHLADQDNRTPHSEHPSLSTPTPRLAYQHHHYGSSSSSLSGSVFTTRIAKPPSIVNLKALGDALRPTKFHNESAVLKAKKTGSGSTPGTPRDEMPPSEKTRQQPVMVSRRKKEKRRQEEIFITMHVAAILQRQEFILLLTRALMMFGGPSHRLESQIQATAKVLDLDLQVVFFYSICIFSFQDEATHTSETKFIKQSANLDLAKLTDLATLHWEVVHDKIGVQEASQEISSLMRAKAQYGRLKRIGLGGLCSAMIAPAAFYASFVDTLISFILGAGLVAVQEAVHSTQSDTLFQVFEIVTCGVTSFVAGALASTGMVCYEAVLSSSIVLILPGWLVCCAALELQSRSIVSGSVRLIWAVIYALFLGLGISLGAEFWTLLSGKAVELSNLGTCNTSHGRGGVDTKWYFRTIPLWWDFLFVPGYAVFLGLRSGARIRSKEFMVMTILSVIGWSVNHFASIGFPSRNEVSSALGSFSVGLLANLYGRMFQGTGYIVAVVPILFQLPSGLGHGSGLLNFARTDDRHNMTTSAGMEGAPNNLSLAQVPMLSGNGAAQSPFVNGFVVGQQLIEVSTGLVVGLFMATVLVYPLGNRRGGLMTF